MVGNFYLGKSLAKLPNAFPELAEGRVGLSAHTPHFAAPRLHCEVTAAIPIASLRL